MAEKQPVKGKTKRLVKNPETFRERALKANTEDDKPKRGDRFKQAGGKIAKPVLKPLKPVGAGTRKIYNAKPLTPLRKTLTFIGRILVPKYVRNSWIELRQVQWPSWRESRKLTYAVLVFAIIFGAAIAGVDYVLDKIFRDILLK